MGRAFTVALVGMVVVFAVLILIILCIMLYSRIIGKAGKGRNNMEKDMAIEPQESFSLPENNGALSINNNTVSINNDTEIVAAITAAIMVCLQGSASGLRVRSIRRVGHTTPIWNIAGRNEQILSRM